jgi:hypothetical protein
MPPSIQTTTQSAFGSGQSSFNKANSKTNKGRQIDAVKRKLAEIKIGQMTK